MALHDISNEKEVEKCEQVSNLETHHVCGSSVDVPD